MKRLLSIIAVLCLFCALITAQTLDLGELNFEIPDEPPDTVTIFETGGEITEEEWVISEGSEEKADFQYKPNQQGDQFVRLNLALEMPIKPKQLRFGGTGTLSYGMFLSDNINLSAKISFAYTTTIGGNIFYFIPFTLCGQYQFLLRNFELPLSIEVGGAIQSYIDRLYFGLVVKPEAGLFYRISPDWSLGIYAGAYVLPQWYSEKEYNYTGIISDIGLSVRYHF